MVGGKAGEGLVICMYVCGLMFGQNMGNPGPRAVVRSGQLLGVSLRPEMAIVDVSAVNGGDLGDRINASLASCSRTGGCIVDARAFSGQDNIISTPIVVDRPSWLLLPSGQMSSTASPLLAITSSNVTVTGQGPGGTVLAATGVGVRVGGSGQLSNVAVEGVEIANGTIGIRVWTGTGAGTVVNSRFERLRIRGTSVAALWIGTDESGDRASSQASELEFRSIRIGSLAGGTAVRCRGRFACQVTTFLDMNVDVSGVYGLHLQETSGPVILIGGAWGARDTTFYLEPSAAVTLNTFGVAEAQGGHQRTVAFGPNATAPAWLSFQGGNLGTGVPDAITIDRDGSTLSVRNVAFNAQAAPVISIRASGVLFDESGCYLGNPYSTLSLAADTVSRSTSRLNVRPLMYEQLGTPPDGTISPCANCSSDSRGRCIGGGSGALAVRLSGTWTCLHSSGRGPTERH